MTSISKKKKRLIMTPGPTDIAPDVLAKMSEDFVHPSLDMDFFDLYRDTTHTLQKIMDTKNDVLILNGEGILGLEAACASLIEPGDAVLVISNGIFGAGFANLAKLYGGKVTLYETNDREPIQLQDFQAFLEENHDFTIATMVHCETPSGLINPIDHLCPLLKSYGILTIVDSVSAIGGIEIHSDQWNIDLLLGGSQKCLSAPSGLSFLSLSPHAKEKIKKRSHPIASFYENLTIWDGWYEKKSFPYTQPVNEIKALHLAATKIAQDPNIYNRHHKEATKVRNTLQDLGITLYPHSGFSDTVTAFLLPEGYNEKHLLYNLLEKENIMIAGSLGHLKGKVMRIGHMGYNCMPEKVDQTLAALTTYFTSIV